MVRLTGMTDKTPKKALILPGAGARGAYQVGVLKAVAEFLPHRARNPFNVISGASAGAINAAVLASRAINFEVAVAEMLNVWSNFSVGQVYRADALTLLRSSLHWFATVVTGGAVVPRPKALLDNEPLRALLTRRINFPRIAMALERGHLDALVVTASAYTSARSVSFYQASDAIPAWRRVRRIGRQDTISLDHLMASAAVPFLFAPVRVGSEFYGDGSMRHQAPLSSAIHLGADRLLVIGVRDEHPDPEPALDAALKPPNLVQIAGYMLDTLFMDGIYSAIERVSRINSILETTRRKTIPRRRGHLREIDTMLIVPSEDIREIAARHVKELPRALRTLLRGMGALNESGMQFISYLLFESGFTSDLIELGYRDARIAEDEIRAFLYDRPVGTLDAPGYIKEQMDV
jgi:NTE family protein